MISTAFGSSKIKKSLYAPKSSFLNSFLMLFILLVSLQLSVVDANIIVKLKDSSTIGEFFRWNPTLYRHVGQVYSFGSFVGFSGNFNLNNIRLLQNSPWVKSIVPDIQVKTTEYHVHEEYEEENTNIEKNENDTTTELQDQKNMVTQQNAPNVLATQYGAPRHLARIQQRQKLRLDGECMF